MTSLCYISNIDPKILRNIGIYVYTLLNKQEEDVRRLVEEEKTEEALHTMLGLHESYFSLLDDEGLHLMWPLDSMHVPPLSLFVR